MGFRLLGPGEESTGFHNLDAVAEDGTVVARYECGCDWCEIWRAAKPMMVRAVADMEQSLGLAHRCEVHRPGLCRPISGGCVVDAPRRPAWLGG